MSDKAYISSLRHESRKLIRELGLLQINQPTGSQSSSHWHALIEISKEPGITVTALSNMLLLSPSTMSRIVDALVDKGLVIPKEGLDKREKSLTITRDGENEIKQIDAFSNPRIIGALDYLSSKDQKIILEAITKYADALEKSRKERESLKIHTLPSSRPIRTQVINMIEKIQVDEFGVAITPEVNACILKAEEEFYFHKKCNFWYATNGQGQVIGSVGLKKVDNKTGEVKKFFVHKDYRGKGIAHKLMKKLLDAARKNKFNQLFLGTVSQLKIAQGFYKKIGFEQITKENLPSKFEACPLDTVFFKGDVLKIETYFKNL